jgi:hypothetical protein
MNAIGQHFPEIHPDKLEMEIPYWKDVIEFDDYSAKLQFPLLKTKPTGN